MIVVAHSYPALHKDRRVPSGLQSIDAAILETGPDVDSNTAGRRRAHVNVGSRVLIWDPRRQTSCEIGPEMAE